MATDPKPEDIMWEHNAIRKQIEFLISSLSGLAAQSNEDTSHSNQLKERITLYRWSLYDFREAVRRHIDLDEHIFTNIRACAPDEGLSEEHQTISQQLDKAIALAENAVYSKLSEEELNKCASDIREIVYRICDSIKAHTAKEDVLLQQAQKEQ